MAFPNGVYAPPGVFTDTKFENSTVGLLQGLRLPVFIGTGSEILSQSNLEIVRGSSTDVDQRVVKEDETGRAVVSISNSGVVTLGDFDGELTKIQVRRYPIVDGAGSGTTATKTSSVSVTVNGDPIVVVSMVGATGILELAAAPEAGDDVRVTYYFKRTDTQVTDTVSDQVTADGAELYGSVGQSYSISTGDNDTLSFTVDDTDSVSVTIPSSDAGTWTAAQIAAFINAKASATTLVASTATNNFGATVLYLVADRNILVGSGTANSTVGLTAGDYTARNKVFYTFQTPIVDGSNGGVTTTDVSDVTVKVNGVSVTPSSVDGASGAVTLPFAPEADAVVTIKYYFNAWQDTYDILYHNNVTSITKCGVTPGRSDYTDEVDFVLQNNAEDGSSRIMWGTAYSVESGTHTDGSTYFNDSQISATLVDTRGYLQPCTAVVDSSVSPPKESRKQFTLPLQPTTGNGRNSPLGTSLFQTVSNERIDLPTNRPDLVLAYWGYDLQDAIERGAVKVTAVDSATSTITLKDAVPQGASVWATFYYNTLTDQAYTLTVGVAGASGVGTFSVTNEDGDDVFTPKFGTKSSGLSTITLQFPSGSEKKPDVRFESLPYGSTSSYAGPVEEDVTVTFASLDGSLGAYTSPGSGDYEIIKDASDHIRITVDGSALASGSTGIDLTSPMGVSNLGFPATMVGSEIAYDASSGYTSYDVDTTNDGVSLLVDGVLVTATAGSGLGVTLADYVTAINSAALAAPPEYTAAGKFLSAVTVVAGEYDQVRFHYTGSTAGVSGNLLCSLTPGTYASVSALAAEVEARMQNAIDSYIATPHAAFAGLEVAVSGDQDGRLVFTLTKASGDASGYLEFITNSTATRDFAVLAGIDTSTATALSQTKVVDGPIALRYTISGDNTSALLHDRLILRSRIVPGYGTVYPFYMTNLGIEVQGGTGSTNTGLVAQDTAAAAWRAAVLPATLLGTVGFAGGQVPSGTYSDARDSQPVVTFYADGGTTSQNNVFKFTMDGIPVTVLFTDASGTPIASGSSADVPLGPSSSSNTVLNQIQAAISAAGISSPSTRCIQEGAAIRLYSATSASSSSIIIGNGNANDILGFTEGDASDRSLVPASEVASALMANSAASIAASLNLWTAPSSSYFARVALAKVVTDDVGAEYLYLQSKGEAGLGTTSSIAIAAPTSDSVLLPTTGLGMSAGDGGTGEDGKNGFYVTSSDTINGSGTGNTSALNGGTGQDGTVGQTYRDIVTGLTFTVLPRSGGSDYPSSEYFTFKVRKSVTTDSNLPVNTIPGLELLVTNTKDVGAGDTGVVNTFERGGEEPTIGDLYYVSYEYTKDDYTTELYTKLASIAAAYGELSSNNPVTLASYLAMLNGAVLVGIKQVQKDTDNNGDGINDAASLSSYTAAVDDLEGSIGNGIFPDVLVPLVGSSTSFFQYINKHADIQSSQRYRAERTVIAGMSSGSNPRAVGNAAQAVGRWRFRLVYPDTVIVSIPQANSTVDEEVLVDGTYLASMLAGSVVSPSVDVATPWTNRRLLGAVKLGRTLDAVEQNQVAVKGVTVIEDRGSVLRVRHGLTTDMTGASTNGNANLSKLPTIAQIVDEVHRQTRKTLDRFIGTKFLPGVLSQIEGQLSNTLKLLVAAQILSAYTGVKASVSSNDPTMAEVEAFIQPVFPLLYIIVTFNMQSKL